MKGKTEQLRKRLLTPTLGGRENAFRWVLISAFVLALGYVLVRGVLEQPRVPDNFTNSYSTSPAGHTALVQLLGERSYKVERRVTPLNRLGPEFYTTGGSCLLLLEPDPAEARGNASEFAGLLADAWRAPNIVLALPKRIYVRDWQKSGDGVGMVEDEYSLAEVNDLLSTCGLTDQISVARTRGPALLSADRKFETKLHDEDIQHFVFANRRTEAMFDVLVSTDTGEPVVISARRNMSNTAAVLISDPDFISNRFIGQGSAASLALATFAATRCSALKLDESMHGLATHASLEYLAATPPGLWVTLSIFLAMFLFGWRESTVLRPAVADTETRRSRGVVIEGVARMMRRARDYTAASTVLLRRAHAHLGGGPVQVHASGMAGSTNSALPKDAREKLEAVQVVVEDGALNVVRVAQVIAELRQKPTGTSIKPKR